MPFSSKNKAIDYKARLEYKLYLAREDPDLKFDLSDCDLKNVPKGVYSICKVLRKESLILKNNVLSSLSGGGSLEELSLLSVLDLRSNRLTALPDSIHTLSSLQELYLNNNLIKHLPESIVRLRKLRVLSAPFNRLKRLPPNIDELSMLEEMRVQGNPALCLLPDRLSLCPRLSRLSLDVGRYTHPPDHVVLQGTSAVLSYLASRLGMEYRGPESRSDPQPDSQPPQPDSQPPSSLDLHIQVPLLALTYQEVKQKECLALEKEMAHQKDQEVLLQNERKKDNVKLVEDLKKQQVKIAEEVLRFQSQKEAERERLIETLKQAEIEADSVVSRLLEMHRASREPWSILQQTELDRAAEQLIFHHRLTGDLKRKEIIAAMESLLKEECSKLTHYEETRTQIIKDSLSKEAEWDDTVTALLLSGRRGSSAVELGDEAGQEAAVATLLERTDLESERLRAQLAIIEQQLAHITATELRRSRLSLDHITSELSVRRCQLSELLMEVLSQREARKGQLLNMLRRMEAIAQGEEDYWLEQYQKLVECQTRLEPRLVRAMVLAGQHRHLPVLINLSSIDLHQLTSHQLALAGVESEEDIAGILKAVRSYLSESALEPSAPPDDMPSAPSVEYQTECVVCMANQCEVVYVPCGHLCCCRSCSLQLLSCPLCRGEILSKVIVIPAT